MFHPSEARPRPDLRDAYPARRRLGGLALAVPVKVHPHPPVGIDVDFLARRADDRGGVRPHDRGPWGGARGTVRERLAALVGGDDGQLVGVTRRASLAEGLHAIVLYTQDHERLAARDAVHVGQGELAAGHHARAVAPGAAHDAGRVELLDTHAREAVTERGLHELAGVIVDRAFGDALGCERTVRVERGLLERVVAEDDLLRAHPLLERHVAHALELPGHPVGPAQREHGIAVDGLERGRIVGDDQRHAASVVIEVVGDALLLEEPRDEIEVGLAVLDAIVPGRVAPGQLPGNLDHSVLGEDGLDDLPRRHALVHVKTPVERQRRQRRAETDQVVGGRVSHLEQLEARHDAVHVADAAEPVDLQGGRLAEVVLEPGVVPFVPRSPGHRDLHVVLERLRQTLGTAERHDA